MPGLKEIKFRFRRLEKYFFNSFWMLLEQFLRILSGVFVGIYIARYLGPESYGLFSYSISLSAVALAVTKLGMDAVLTRELVKSSVGGAKFRVLMGSAFGLMTIAALLSYAVLVLAVSWIEVDYLTKVLVALACASCFFVPALCVDYFFLAKVKAKIPAICKSLTLLAGSLSKLILIKLNAGLIALVFVSCLEGLLLAGLLFISYSSAGGGFFFRYFSFKMARRLLKSSWPIAVSAIAVIVYAKSDHIIIKIMLGSHELGLYSAAVKIFEAWIVMPYVVTISLIPLLVKAKAGVARDYERLFVRVVRLLVWPSVGVAILVTLIGDRLIMVAFGADYEGSTAALIVCMWASIFSTLGSISFRYFNIENMGRKIAERSIFAAALNIVLNFILIPWLGILGAAVATLICTFVAYYLADAFDHDARELWKIKNSALFFIRYD